MDAFNRLVSFRAAEYAQRPDVLPAINGGFIKILEHANRESKRAQVIPAGKLPKDYKLIGPFLGNAIQAVAALHDPRALPVLLEDIETGNMATEALAAFGNPAVRPLLDRLNASSEGAVLCSTPGPRFCIRDLRFGALRALTQMAVPTIFHALCPLNQSRIRSVITAAMRPVSTLKGIAFRQAIGLQGAGRLGDRSLEPEMLEAARKGANCVIRQAAVIALGELHDPASRPALQEIAASDPDPVVRGTAQIALKKLGGGQ